MEYGQADRIVLGMRHVSGYHLPILQDIGGVPVSLRVDLDVLAAYVSTGKGYQSRMNEALRRGAKSL
jgi:hypothetical protein